VTTRRPAREVLDEVVDPEIPVLTIADLGVLREVREVGGRVEVTITPTYSGCPAMDVIRTDIEVALHAAGYPDVTVRTVLAPAWTTDWMSTAGRQKLAAYGIAPPATSGSGPVLLELGVCCPQCHSADTRRQSRCGSTACKSLWVCNGCSEPFDHFRAI
jgi:ring-1,2-phenylacetyl-CoA epoxidase subunit PaaD